MSNTRTDTDRYAFVPGSAPYPTIVSAEGCWLIAADGRRILDGAAGAIVGNIGWGRTEVAEAAAAIMPIGYVIPLWPTPSRLALQDELIQHWLPEGFNHVFFTSGGSESTDSAIRLARAYQVGKGRGDRWKVIGRHPSYHGMTTGTMAVASHLGRQKGYEPLLLPFPKVPWDDPEMVLKVIEQEDPATIAGFIAEPITGAAGVCLTASDEYWQVVTQACHEHDILLIADEVMTGYGRTGLKFGHQHFPFEPDVIVGGKGLGGGYVPLGAVAARDEVADALVGSGFMYFTFTGNDAACAAGSKVLEIMRRENLVARSASQGAVLGKRLHAEFDGHPAVAEVRGRGMFYGLELRCNRDAVVMAALERDLWIYPAGSGPVPDAVMVAPPFVVTDAEIEQIVLTTRALPSTQYSPADMTGIIALQGGGPFLANDELDRRLLGVVGATKALVLPTADAFEHPERLVAAAMTWAERLNIEVEALMVLRRGEAMEAGPADIVRTARAVYFVGDQPLHLRSVLKDTPLWDALLEVLANGGLVVGVAGSAAALCDPMVDPRGGAFTLGLGLVPDLALVTEAESVSPERLHRTRELANTPLAVLHTGDALVRRAATWELVGAVEVHGELP